MRVRFCGVRGSTPAPGSEFVRIGGHTSCVAVWPDGSDVPRLLLDAGTGLRAVTPLLGDAAFSGTILLSHLHWDHVQGLPFFAAGDRADATVELVVPRDGVPAEELLARSLSPPHFPIGPGGLLGSWKFTDVDEGWHVFEGMRVLAREVPHKGGRTFGYRVVDRLGSVAYLPDHRPDRAGPWRRAARALADGVDVLVHDAQFLGSEDVTAAAYGHATLDQAVALAEECNVGELVLFHHAPGRTDDEVEALLGSGVTTSVAVRVAIEGVELLPGCVVRPS